MNEDLRLGFALNDFAGTKWKNLTGTARWLVAQQPQLRPAVGGRAVVGNLQLAPARPVLR